MGGVGNSIIICSQQQSTIQKLILNCELAKSCLTNVEVDLTVLILGASYMNFQNCHEIYIIL